VACGYVAWSGGGLARGAGLPADCHGT
jgi:hypothetical protein